MPAPIHVYASAHTIPALPSGLRLRRHRDLSDPSLRQHLRGFQGFLSQSDGPATPNRTAVAQLIRHTRHHLVIDGIWTRSMTTWARHAMAVFLDQDQTLRDPNGRALAPGEADPQAHVPVAEDAVSALLHARRWCATRRIVPPTHMPPGLGARQAVIKTTDQIVARALALLAVAARAETWGAGQPMSRAALIRWFGDFTPTLSPDEHTFLDASDRRPRRFATFSGQANAGVDCEAHALTWRYESAAKLLHMVGLWDQPDLPRGHVDAARLLDQITTKGPEQLYQHAAPIDAQTMLAEQARIRCMAGYLQAHHRRPVAVGPTIAAVPVGEQHRAMNWATGQWAWGWDDVDTPH